MVNMDVDLFAIVKIDGETIYLENWFFNKKRVYKASSKEIEYYQYILQEAIEHNIFLFVEFDEKMGVILQH